MTPDEWDAFTLELDKAFRGDFGPQHEEDVDGLAQEATYRAHLGGLPYAEATAALALLVQRGQVFMPTPGEIIRAHAATVALPTPPFRQAWSAIARAYRRHGDSPEAVARITNLAGEGAARFAVAHGLRSLMMEPVEGDHGGAVRHRLAQSYAEHCERAADDRRVGFALEQARRRALSGGEGLRRLTLTVGEGEG